MPSSLQTGPISLRLSNEQQAVVPSVQQACKKSNFIIWHFRKLWSSSRRHEAFYKAFECSTAFIYSLVLPGPRDGIFFWWDFCRKPFSYFLCCEVIKVGHVLAISGSGQIETEEEIFKNLHKMESVLSSYPPVKIRHAWNGTLSHLSFNF